MPARHASFRAAILDLHMLLLFGGRQRTEDEFRALLAGEGFALERVVANPVVDYMPSARSGGRAPHLWLQRDGRQISTLDLFDTSFVLLTGPAGEAWRPAAEQIAEHIGMPLRCYAIGPDGPLIDATGAWMNLYGVAPDGAVLVRPDGNVAWRSPFADASPAVRLADALSRILSRDGPTPDTLMSP